MPDFLLPDLGEGLAEAEVITWHVCAGDQVTVDQVVVEVETAKAAVEVPVPFTGTVTALHAPPGTTVAVGQPLMSVATDGQKAPGRLPEPPVATAEAGGLIAAEEPSGSVLIGYGTGGAVLARRRPLRRKSHQPSVSSGQLPGPTAPDQRGQAAGGTAATGRDVGVISPLVRKLAREAGLDLTGIAGTGPCGIIRRHDVELAVREQQARLARLPEQTLPPSAVAPGGARIPLRGMRRTAAEKFSRSRREIPEATVWVDVDATETVAARAALNASRPGQPVSLLALIARFAILALRAYPELNARLDHDEIVVPDHVHLGFAAQTEQGLVVPVVPHADRLTTRELAAAIAARAAAARSGRLSPGDLTGGTITINNYGVFGVDGSAAIINHPEVAIVGVGRIVDRPWAVGGQLAVRKVGQLTLAFDHRVCDGGTAGGFLRQLADCVEMPATALGDL